MSIEDPYENYLQLRLTWADGRVQRERYWPCRSLDPLPGASPGWYGWTVEHLESPDRHVAMYVPLSELRRIEWRPIETRDDYMLRGPDERRTDVRYPAEPQEAPELEACRECWAAPDAHDQLPCGHDVGRHKWTATHGFLAVKHRALSAALAGRFRYPLTEERLEQFRELHRQALVNVNVDPDETVVPMDEAGFPVPVPGERHVTGESLAEARARHAVVEVSALEWWVEPDATIPAELLAELAAAHPAPKPSDS